MEFFSLEADFIDCRFSKADVLKAELTITCSKAIIKTLEQGVNYVQSKQQKPRSDVTVIVLMPLYLTLNMFHALHLCFFC